MSGAWERGLLSVSALVTGLFSGGFVVPVLLPYIPFREFAVKGIITGSVFAMLLMVAISPAMNGMAGVGALFLFSMVISSYLAMNFTGTTPFTSPSGVEKEMKRFIPVQVVALAVSTCLWICSAF